ncbi:MAG: PAS domain S-box protein [Smithellaceae bacterium]
MTSKSEKNRIHEMIDAARRAAAGDVSVWLDASSRNDDLDQLALAINALIKKTVPSTAAGAAEKSVSPDADQRYYHILDSMQESYFETDLKGNILFFNDRVVRELGYSPGEIRGMNFLRFVDAAIAKKLYEIFHHVYLTGDAVSGFQWQLSRKDGRLMEVESSVTLLRDEAGKPRGFRGVVRDVSPRVRAEKELRQSEERYRTILDIMQESYIEYDLQGRITFANETACRFYGYEPGELIGMSYREYHPPDEAQRMYEIFHQIYKTGEPRLQVDNDLISKDGILRSYQLNAALRRDEAGTPCGFRVLTWDVTDRKKAQESLRASEVKYRSILENMQEAYLETDLRGNFVFFNDALCDLFGYSRRELQTMNYRDFIAPETVSAVWELFNGIYRTNEQKKILEHELLAKGNRSIIVQMSVSLMHSPTGRPAGFRGIARDMTARIRADKKIQKSEKRLRMITDNIHDVIWTMDFSFCITYVSPAALSVFGYTPDEFAHLSLNDYLTPESAARVEKVFAEELPLAMAGQTHVSAANRLLELEITRKDGSLGWVEIKTDFNCDEKGVPFEILGITRDISDRKKSEAALRESEKLHRMIVESMHDSISLLDLNLQYVYQSPSEIRVTGFTPEEIKQMPLAAQMTPASYALVKKVIAEEFALEFSGRPVDPHRKRIMELESYTKGGTTIIVEVTASFYRDEDGKAVGLLINSRDITDRKKAQEAFRESEKRYRMIVENMHDTIWTMDLDLHYTYQSPSEIRVTGYTPEEIMHLPLQEILMPESFERAAAILARELEKEQADPPPDPNRSVKIELEMRHKQGHTIWQEVTASFNRDEKGRPVEIMFVGRNITERKQVETALRESEKRYRMIVENMQDTITVLDFDLNYLYQSPSEIRVTGYTPEEILKIPIQQQVTPESFERGSKMLAEELELELSGRQLDPHRSLNFEFEIYRKDGGTVWLEVTSSFNRDENGRPVSILLAGRDISERKKAADEKEHLEKQLQQAQKLETVGRLAGGVAHDFNNMLNVILGYADLAKLRLTPSDPIYADLQEIEKAACRSRDLTAQLLAFSRKQIIAPRPVNLNRIITDTQKAIGRLIGEDIDLRFYPGEDLRAIKFDPMQIEQILMNLAVNARDAMPTGGKFAIETSNVDIDTRFCREHLGFSPGPYVLLTVSDTGTGIDEDHLPYVFEPFFTTKEVGKGTGLGLATVYGIVQQNHGLILVHSEPGQGSTFRLYFPESEEPVEVEEIETVPPVRSGEGTILLVEDDEMVLKMVTDMLEALGYMVIAAENPLDALSLCEKGSTPIDLVITDVVMPVMSGAEMRNKLKISRPDLKVLFMSGYNADIIVHHGVLEEGVQFIQKPFSMSDLARKIRELLQPV